jgi:hypothetical protein
LALNSFDFYSERRIARAFDLSAKRKDLPAELREYSAYDVSPLVDSSAVKHILIMHLLVPLQMHLAKLSEVTADEIAEKVVMRS